MSLRQKAKDLVRAFKHEVAVYQAILRDGRTPKAAKFFLGLAIAYFFSPIDPIPDWIPIIGYLDELVVIPALIFIALRFVPPGLVAEHRARLARESAIPGT